MSKKQDTEVWNTSLATARTLAEIEQEMFTLLELGYRTSQRIAVLVGLAKEYHFDAVPDWLSWCADRFGYARRTAFQLAKVGKFLWSACGTSAILLQEFRESASTCTPDPILSCDLHKLEYLATLYEEKPDQCMGLVKHWNPAEHTREQVRDKVRAFLGDEVFSLVCQDCKEEFESDSRKTKLCPACDAKRKERAEKEKERRASCAFEKHLTALAEKFDRPNELAPHVAETGPSIAMAASMVAANLATAHVNEYHDWTKQEAMKWLEMVDELQDMLRGIVAASNE